jgi:hypothetical protein
MDSKKQLLNEVREYAPSDAHTKMARLLHACIRELRIKNDTAASEDILRNQGAIAELKLILKGINLHQKYKEYSGGFDE